MSQFSSQLSSFLFLLFTLSAKATPIDNKIEANTLEVKCLADGIQVSFQTWKSFSGHVYVKGQFSQSQCHTDYTNSVTQDTKVTFKVPFQGCNAKRERSLNPPGVYFTSTLVAQFHHLFITKVDRAYSLQCFYMEATKTLTQGIDVSMLPETDLLVSREMPLCTYTVHTGSIDGPYAKFAKVGDPIYHKWQCPGDVYGILIHSCNAKDGIGAEYELIDKQGCSVDPVIVGDLIYSSSLNMASVEVHAFKFADKLQVSFQCQVTLCFKADNSCKDVTPPNCAPKGHQSHASSPQPAAYGSPVTSQNPYALPTTKYPIGPTNTSPYGNLGALSPSATAYQPPVNTSQNPYVLVARQPSASPPNQYGPAVITTVGPSNPYKIDPAGVNYLGRQKRNDKSNRSNDKAKFADTMDLTSEEMLVFNTDDNVPDGNFLKSSTSGSGGAKQLCLNMSVVAQMIVGTLLIFMGSIAVTIFCQRRCLLRGKSLQSATQPSPETQLHY